MHGYITFGRGAVHAMTIVCRRTTGFPTQMRRRRSLTALAFVSSMSESLRIKTCCSSVGVHHTAATSSNDHSDMMLPSLHAESHGLARFVMVRLSWHNKHRHVAQRVGSTYEASHPTERRCSSGKDKEAVPENGFKRWRMNNVPVTSD